jgi:hypothetical protein
MNSTPHAIFKGWCSINKHQSWVAIHTTSSVDVSIINDILWSVSWCQPSQSYFIVILSGKYSPELKFELEILSHLMWQAVFNASKYSSRYHEITVKPLFVFVGGLKKKQWIRENNRCRSHSWNRIHSGTIEIERWIRENELSGNDR